MTVDDPTSRRTESTAGIQDSAGTCTNCGRWPAPTEYTLRFATDGGDDRQFDREIDLPLCPVCLAALCREPGIERS